MNTSPAVLCSLINSLCVPVVMYASEALSWSKRNLNSLDRVYSQVFHKIFRVFVNVVIRQCHYFMGCLPLSLLAVVRKLNFLSKINKIGNNNMHLQPNWDEENCALCNKYNFPEYLNDIDYKYLM